MQVLKGIRVLDFSTHLPAPLGTNMLAQLGADVLKVERIDKKDPIRNQMPGATDNSKTYLAVNSLKKNLIIDFKNTEAQIQLIEEIKNSDVLIESARPGAMKSFGLGFDDVKLIKPDIIYVSVSGFGQTGALHDKASHDLNYLALTGVLSTLKDENGKPILPYSQIADTAGGSYMLIVAVLTALLNKKNTNKAQYIDLSIASGIAPTIALARGIEADGLTKNLRGMFTGMLVNYNVYRCQDKKWMVLAALELKFWHVFCDGIGQPDWKKNSYEDLIRSVPKKAVEDIFIAKTQAEWTAFAKEHDCCLSPVYEIGDVATSPYIQEKNLFGKDCFEFPFVIKEG
ncbi:MAG: CaiB/BaiF CoA-transferase family protein [Phycisphaerales bacterium]|nr:CaiB/BaiF CoA-transferase family protein [Phycisphaerales bacterium]